MSRIRRHLMWISLVVILTLFGACWMFAAAASETAGTHVLTFVPRPTPEPHP